MIREMSPATAKKVLETLVAEGKVEADEVLEAISISPSTEMMRIVDIMHSLLCDRQHGDPEDLKKKGKKKLCFYPLEESMDGTWSNPFHQKWLGISLDTMRTLSIGTEDQARIVMKQVRELSKFQEAAIRIYITGLRLEPLTLPEDD